MTRHLAFAFISLLAIGIASAALAAPAVTAARPEAARSEAAPLTLPYALRHQIGEPGVARTAVERGRRGVTGSAGFLCGRQDIANRDGSAGAYDFDPHGRFVGASLRLTFR